MGSLDAARTRAANKVGVLTHLKDDESVAIRLKYVGTGSVTSVTVATAASLTLVTSDGGTDTYDITAAAYDTVGELVDAINADGIFEAKVLDGLRSDALNGSQLVDGAVTSSVLDGVTIWDLKTDTSVLKKVSVCVTPDRGFSMGDALKGRKWCKIKKFSYNVNVNAASANAVKIYKRVGSTETLVADYTSVDVTDTDVFDYTGSDADVTVKPGEEYILSVQDATSVTDAAANFIETHYDVL